ncbi:subtilisin-like protein [Annulohypoxylon truncatum]|uniref:subtilisin-like protein n=1 Tax=Annulohypoxylon truncatum TaxID=327061 RepID=UPI002007A432|nr:subtilisin-like protein [Annulohypoxylon truncatum]KAI1211407.1 subtilisin-like protein [Annulohypoxylon truncatum]
MLPFAIFAAFCAFVSATRDPRLVDGALIIEFADNTAEGSIGPEDFDQHAEFHKHAILLPLNYTIAHEYRSPGMYNGLSIRISEDGDSEAISSRLGRIPGVLSVSPVYEMFLSDPGIPGDWPTSGNPLRSYEDPLEMPIVSPKPDGKLVSTLEMAGVDKLHQLGIKGKDVKVGIIDTGVDYRHPALGGGVGPGFKIAGGWSWLADNGTAVEDDNFLATCYGGGHGTHVAGIVGMNPLSDGNRTLNISGVAPEATLYIYRVFDCSTNGETTDRVMAAMLRAQVDGVDVISMSLSIQESWQDRDDPLMKVASRLVDAGIAVIVAQGNSGSGSKYDPQLYRTATPAELPAVISVGSVASKTFPLVYTLTDSQGDTIHYASLWPIEFPDGLGIYLLDNGCSGSSDWDEVISLLGNQGKLNSTVVAFPITDSCRYTGARSCCSKSNPPFIMGLHADTSNPYNVDYEMASTGFFGDGSVQYIAVNANDSKVILANMNTTGPDQYKLYFNDSSYSSPPRFVGGKMDYYSSFGPIYLSYDLKPQISAPGGEILSTWPLGDQGYYTILSGTSMATPFISGCYALVKSQFPELSVAEILSLLQSTSSPITWVWNDTMIAGTFQQGAGLVNVYKAVTYQSRVLPGQLLVGDNSRTEYGAVNITIENNSNVSKIYALSHEGASYSEPNPPNNPIFSQENQLPIYGSAEFESPTVQVAAGESAVVSFKILPPSSGVKPERQPVFGGFIKVTSGDEEFSVPYSGAPFSLYNAAYFHIVNTSDNVQPSLSYKFADDWVIDRGLFEVNSSLSYRSLIGRDQFTRGYRIDLVPANISITPDLYGFNPTETYEYRPSTMAPPTEVFGLPSYGILANSTELLSPSTFNWPSGTGVTATLPNGTEYSPGLGDYRWLASVLRWGGDPELLEDHETWLSAVIRLVDGPVSAPPGGSKDDIPG